ncbi:MAG TPA: VWA domain-containing protein, partial [Gemmatimonadales bacterium]|nr:VWA domain-containing protein [Gemmatimonadales bacterium]
PMKPRVKLSTRFLTARNAHQVGMLVTLEGETPVRRAPINVALVLDRSGSMAGDPLAAAQDAARRFVSFLSPEDRLSVVTFDSEAALLFGPAPGGDPVALTAISRINAGGMTNLSGGWLRGLHLVQEQLVDGTNRVVLFTDGQANRGIIAVPELVNMAAAASAARVSTTCIGFGAEFNEDLLEPMARAGSGNYWFIEGDDQMAAVFENEITGLVALAAQNVEVTVRLTHPRAAGVTLLQSLPITQLPDGSRRIAIGDLYATSPRSVGLRFHVEDVAELGPVQVAEVIVDADVVTEQGIIHRTITMPVMAALDRADHVEPMVEDTILQFQAAQAREQAIRLADAGDFDAAASCLRESIVQCAASDSPEVRQEAHDLECQMRLLRSRRYSAIDRKYDSAVAMSLRDGKQAYARQLRRKRGR